MEHKGTDDTRYAKQSERLGDTVKELRFRSDETLSVLAKRCGLSASTISKIERGQLSPTYETILRLADGLGVDLSALFEGHATPLSGAGRRSVTRGGEGHRYRSPHYNYEFLSPELSRKHFTPLLATVNARDIAEFKEFSRHDGEEFIYVLKGEIIFYTEHYEPVRLNTGDSCYLDSQMGHALVSVSEEDAEIMWITSRLTPDTNSANVSATTLRAEKKGTEITARQEKIPKAVRGQTADCRSTPHQSRSELEPDA